MFRVSLGVCVSIVAGASCCQLWYQRGDPRPGIPNDAMTSPGPLLPLPLT